MNRGFNRYFIFNPVLIVRKEWFYPMLTCFERYQYYHPDKLRYYQNVKLQTLLDVARTRSVYYRDRIPVGVDLQDLPSLDYLDKEALRKHGNDILTSKTLFCRRKTTGGSTGAPVTVYKDSRAMAMELAAAYRGYGWAGIKIGDRQARFWGVPQTSFFADTRARLIDFVCNRYRVSAFGYDDDNWLRISRALHRFKPDYFYGYVSIIRDFARFVGQPGNGFKIGLQSIVTTAEVLESIDRHYISDRFGCRVFNEYGCGEVGTIAHECEEGSLHVTAENLIVEIVDKSGNPLAPGNPGEIVVTDLHNTAMPLIRYRLSDYGMISLSDCACGRGLPVLEKVYGRAYDTLVNFQGKLFHGEFFLYIMEDAKKKGLAVDGVQFVQSLDFGLTVNLVCEDWTFNPLCTYIEERLRQGFDPKIIVAFKKCKTIEREKSGKLRVVKRVAQEPLR